MVAAGSHTAPRFLRKLLFPMFIAILDVSCTAAFEPARPALSQVRLYASKQDAEARVLTLEGTFDASRLADYWGREPVLMRQAFSIQESWPSWELMEDIACEEDAPVRVIRHVPGDLTSYTLDIGPFDDVIDIQEPDNHIKWTLVVNDVDRFHPPLSDWMDQTFPFIPRWRRDDAQVSIAAKGGGIGPHVDNYDVFLIQTSGDREWQISLDKIPVKDEFEAMVPDCEVRILRDWSDRPNKASLMLKPGDMLYLPPRIPHCGTALTDQCMTLSVGCRAPSAADLVARLAEDLGQSVAPKAVQRFEDLGLLRRNSLGEGELSTDVKDRMKALVLEAVIELMEDESQFDALVGKLVTEPNRPREEYPLSLDEADPEWIEELGVWGIPDDTLKAVRNGDGSLYRAEGVSATFSTVGSSYRLFMNGEMFEITPVSDSEARAVRSLFSAVVNTPKLTSEVLLPISESTKVVQLLEELVHRGFIYGSSSD